VFCQNTLIFFEGPEKKFGNPGNKVDDRTTILGFVVGSLNAPRNWLSGGSKSLGGAPIGLEKLALKPPIRLVGRGMGLL
jgi:hypothetical protein